MWCQIVMSRSSKCSVKILRMRCQDPQNAVSRSSEIHNVVSRASEYGVKSSVWCQDPQNVMSRSSEYGVQIHTFPLNVVSSHQNVVSSHQNVVSRHQNVVSSQQSVVSSQQSVVSRSSECGVMILKWCQVLSESGILFFSMSYSAHKVIRMWLLVTMNVIDYSQRM